jgi:hypothetical protein
MIKPLPSHIAYVLSELSKAEKAIGDIPTWREIVVINPYGLLVDERRDMASQRWNPLGDLEPHDALTFRDDPAE